MGRKTPWSVERVRELLDFSCGGRFGASDAMVRMQLEGVAALCAILARRRVAYLADEVGLGKTMQALGVAACLASTLPSARILVVSPRRLVQNSWKAEAARFGEYVLRPGARGLQAQMHESLREWLPAAAEGGRLHLLRHSSFMRPVFHAAQESWEAIVQALELPDEARPHLLRERPRGLDAFACNQAYARGVNRWLASNCPRFDLVIVDEAQCLRHIDGQQTNTVFSTLLQGRAARWLFLSATPAHSSVRDIATVLNRYPGQGMLIPESNLDDPAVLRRALAPLMIRRPRTFMVGDRHIHKREYRFDDTRSLELRCEDPLGLLSIAMVQRHLAHALGREGGRFRNGFIASFESLEDSLRDRTAPALAQQEGLQDGQPEDDFYAEHSQAAAHDKAPDLRYVGEACQAFEKRFGFGLPHPKLDGVERDLSLQAFGDRAASREGGRKTVVFCRRLSSVRVLRQRLMQCYLEGIRARCLAVWNEVLDWDARLAEPGQEPGAEAGGAPEPADDGLNRVREAHARGRWLHRFRMAFQDGNRHAQFFELNWFERLCREAGIRPEDAAQRVPAHLWGQARALATVGDKRYRAREAQCLVWLCLDRHGAQVFGFDAAQVAFWRTVLGHVLSPASRAEPAPDAPRAAPQAGLLTFRSIWALAEARDARLALPDAAPGAPAAQRVEALYWRKIVATVLGQYMRLSDTAIDLYFADRQGAMASRFVGWLVSADIDGRRLRQVWMDWIAHHRLIFSSAVGEREGQGPAKLAGEDSFDFLYHLDPVVGITGSTGGQKRALQQFNTPGLPYVMVGTDAIREGLNLHLFCDRVMHYGMPWTPGDMEQRVGRVDRFFGRIERRLHAATAQDGPVQLQVLYPHLSDTIEAQQIRTVMHRKRESDAVMEDDMLGGASCGAADQRTVELDAVLAPVASRAADSPVPDFGTQRHLR